MIGLYALIFLKIRMSRGEHSVGSSREMAFFFQVPHQCRHREGL